MLHRKRCCHCVECTIASDNFNRADSSDIGANWTETSGSFSISGNTLVPSASFENIALFNTPDPEDPADDGIRWSAKFNFGGSNGTIYLIVDYVDANNFRYAAVQCSDATTAVLGVYEKISGSDTALTAALSIPAFSWTTTYPLSVCWGLQGIVPACSEGSTVWVWTDNGDSTFAWQPRLLYDDCTEPGCNPVYPAFDGTVEGEETTTGCVPTFGTEGQPVFGIAASIGSNFGIAAVAEPLGGTTVGLLTAGASTSAFLDDAALSRLKSGCPECTALTTCTNCETLTAPRFLVGVVAGITNDDCDFCAPHNGTYVMGSGTEQAGEIDCEGTGYGPGCGWGTGVINGDCTYNFGFSFRIIKHEGEYFLVAYHGVVVQDPGDPEPIGFWVRWRKSLGVLLEDPDCNTLFDEEHVLTFYCQDIITLADYDCDYTASTITVSKP